MRKLYYVKPKIQYAFTKYSTFLSAIEILIFSFMLFILEARYTNHPRDIQIYIKFSLLFLCILVFAAFNFWISIRFSHRIVGPLIQIQRILDQAIRGRNGSRIQLRSDDYLHEVGDRINILLDKIEKDGNTQKVMGPS
jgi:sensor histidine kinase YesM